MHVCAYIHPSVHLLLVIAVIKSLPFCLQIVRLCCILRPVYYLPSEKHKPVVSFHKSEYFLFLLLADIAVVTLCWYVFCGRLVAGFSPVPSITSLHYHVAFIFL